MLSARTLWIIYCDPKCVHCLSNFFFAKFPSFAGRGRVPLQVSGSRSPPTPRVVGLTSYGTFLRLQPCFKHVIKKWNMVLLTGLDTAVSISRISERICLWLPVAECCLVCLASHAPRRGVVDGAFLIAAVTHYPEVERRAAVIRTLRMA